MNRFPVILFIITAIVLVLIFERCTFKNILARKTQREAFAEQLKRIDTALAAKWIRDGDSALNRRVKIPSPYFEKAVFSNAQPVVALEFTVIAGRRIKIEIEYGSGRKIFADLFRADSAGLQIISEADTTKNILETPAVTGGMYVVRLQPQPGYDSIYNFTLSTEPILSWPVKDDASQAIGSSWGADRDGGRRSHQGVDIFAKRGTPLVAAADGYVHRVTTNNLGGKVIFMRPEGLPISLYYAHLDSQIIASGTSVKQGEIIGTVGNTGNAANTPPHLHFGIYAKGGAIDPVGFLQKKSVPAIRNAILPENRARQIARIIRLYPLPDAKVTSQNLSRNDSVFILAATSNYYRVITSSGNYGYITQMDITK